jgi:DNA helicase-2/ATP-dependent DNA helicase PcrA
MSLALIRSSPAVDLNPEQQLAVEHGIGDVRGPGPLLVIAGAGSGKTAMLAHRVAALILSGADPKRIMLATFSRRAAAELGRRVERLLARRLAPEAAAASTPAYAGTFHAIGARLLREYATRLGLDPQFTIHDREDSADLMNWARHEMGVGDLKQRFPTKATCLTIYSRVVNAQGDLKATIGKWFPWVAGHEDALRGLFASYVEMKQRQNVLDYDDLLLYLSQMLTEPAIAAEIAGRFDHLLVDEYQDTNALQGDIVLRLRPCGRGLTVVGDDAQSIYSFRAATVRNILDFPRAFEPPAHVVTLEQNYRSSGAVLAAANAVIALAPERFAKTLRTDRPHGALPQLVAVADDAEQARFITARVLANREAGAALKAQAVLFRASHHSAALELELTRRNIPFVKFGGLKFLDAAHVKDAVALMRFAENPRDRVAGFRVAQLLPGVGPKVAETIIAAAAADDGFVAMSALSTPPRARDGFPAFADLMRRLASRAAPWPGEIADAVAWLSPLMESRYDDARIRMGDLEALERIASTFPSRERFLSERALDPPDATSDEAGPPLRDEDFLILSTIHSAKGQEWRSVFVLNCVDGCIPSDLATGSSDEIEEERRLLYVAMTRAKDDLALLVPQRFYVHGQPRNGDRSVYAARTRFIPPPLLKHFDRQTWPEAAPMPPRAPTDGPRVDLQARMRGMWR